MTSRPLALLLSLFVLASCRGEAPPAPAAPALQPSPAVTRPQAARDAREAQAPVRPASQTSEAGENVLDAALRADDTLASAQARLGAANVVAREIHEGEGVMSPGWVLFPDDPARRVDVFLDEAGRHPLRLRVNGERSTWRRSDGVRLGMTSVQLQAMNGRPFELSGFHWDYAGTITDWRGGRFLSGEASLGFVRLCASDPEPEGYPIGEAGVLSDIPLLVAHPPMVCEYSVGL